MNKISIIVVLLLAIQPAKSDTLLSLQPSFHHFDYTEFGLLNQELDSETGWLPGVTLGISTNIGQYLNAKFEVAQYRNDLKYIGTTNDGNPHTTITEEEISYLGLRLSIPIQSEPGSEIRLFASTRYYEWERNIRDSGNVSGLFEIYRWWELSAGIGSEIGRTDSYSWFVEASLLYIQVPEIYVDLSRINGGTTTLDMEEEFGGRLQLASVQTTSINWSFDMAAYVEFWDFGRSNSRLTSGGSRQFIVTEPRSETRNIGFKISYTYTFQ